MKKEKEPTSRLKGLLAKSRSGNSVSGKVRKYERDISAPIPQGFDHISVRNSRAGKKKIGGAKVIPQKSGKLALEQLHCTHNQNYPLFFIEKAEALQLKSVRSLRVKERLIAARNIKNVSREIQRWIYAQVHQEVKILEDEAMEFRNLLENREERHFRMDRIIKYLSEP